MVRAQDPGHANDEALPRRRRNDQEKKADAEGAKRRRDEKKKLAQRAKVSDTAVVSAHV